MSQDGLPFVYAALQPGEIRLLHSKIEDDSEITWTLTNAQLLDPVDSPLQFDALSCAWGELGETFPLNCNGRQLQIHHNLNKALPYLARRRSSLLIWIDAVCINQDDQEEKRSQIRLMSKLYRRADTVWAWLGFRDQDAITVLDDLVQAAPEIKQ